ncbi:MAG: ABC transporter ATP-binding protein [Myxococcota bacterium]
MESIDETSALIRGERFRLVAAVLLVSLSALLELVPHLVVYLAAIEVFAPTVNVTRLMWLAAAAFAGVVLRFVLLGGGYILSHAVAFRLMRRLRLALAHKLARVPGRYLQQHSGGELKKTVIDDVASLEGVFAHNIPEFCSGLFVPIVAAALLFAADWRMGALSLALVPVAFVVQATFMRGYESAFSEWQAAETRANEGVLEFIRGIVALKAFNREVKSLERVRTSIVDIRDLANAMTRRSMAGYSLFFTLLSGNLLVVLPAGAWLHLSGTISRESFVLFVALGTGMLAPLLKLLFLFGSLQQVKAAWVRVRDLLFAKELHVDRPVDRAPDSTLRFDAVSFAYQNRDERALSDISLSCEPGTVTALVGPSGSGKTTLLRLALREYDAHDGAITIGGVELQRLRPEQLYDCIAHVAQTTTLFDASVFDNLRLAKPEATREEVVAAARRAHVHHVLESLPNGYDTVLGDRGGRLSGGERQRVAIARALLKDAPIVLLDEVTANVDPESERGIQRGLSELARDRVVLVVAHRLRTIVDVDQIGVLDAGRLVDCGPHQELLKRCETYVRLWAAQSEAEGWSLAVGSQQIDGSRRLGSESLG